MPAVSVITAATRPDRLDELYTSLMAQQSDWEWLIQLDGNAIDWTPDPGRVRFLDDPRVDVARNPTRLGSGTTRNQALMRATADFILCVDDDDRLFPDALARLAAALTAHEDCFGAWGRTYTSVESAEPPVLFRSWPREETIAPGTIVDAFEQSATFLVHVGSVLWRRSHLVAVGGYGALPRSIDTNPFLACQALFPLRYVDVPVYLYNLHGGQMTRTAEYEQVRQRVHAFNFERARALQKLVRPAR